MESCRGGLSASTTRPIPGRGDGGLHGGVGDGAMKKSRIPKVSVRRSRGGSMTRQHARGDPAPLKNGCRRREAVLPSSHTDRRRIGPLTAANSALEEIGVTCSTRVHCKARGDHLRLWTARNERWCVDGGFLPCFT